MDKQIDKLPVARGGPVLLPSKCLLQNNEETVEIKWFIKDEVQLNYKVLKVIYPWKHTT